MSIYKSDDIYNRAIEQLATVPPCPVTGGIDRDALKIILGETLDLWPASIAASVDEGAAKDAAIIAKRKSESPLDPLP